MPQAKKLGDDVGMRLLLPVGRSGWAIAAGYAGLFALLLFPAPIALILGIVGWRDIRRSRGTAEPKHGMGRVVFALITGGLGTAILIAIPVAILFFGKQTLVPAKAHESPPYQVNVPTSR
jgi:hypothetical protein